MGSAPMHTFECQMYVTRHGAMELGLPSEPGPIHVARLQPLAYEELVDPSFRRLLAAFETLPTQLQVVQV
jgi:hypothetical protein